MLHGLDDKPWGTLSHAYGKAANVPALLRDLTGSSAKKRGKALFELGAAICHQGTLFSATVVAVPFLIELVALPKVKDRDAILGLLANIVALDDHEQFLVDGFPAKVPTTLPAAFRRALAAVHAGSDTYAALLADKEALVRSRAAFLLAWIPDAAATSAPLVRAALEREKDDGAAAALCLALAYLDPKASFDAQLGKKSVVVKTAAALATAHVRRGDVDAKVRALLAAAAVKKKLVVPGLGWLGGDLAFFAVRALAAMSGDTVGFLVSAVEAGGEGARFAANVVVRRLFTPVPNAPKAPQLGARITRRDQEEDRLLAELPVKLDAVDMTQRRLLNALAASDAGFDDALAAALQERGLPTTQALMKRFVAGPQSAATSILDREIAWNGGKKTLGEVYLAANTGEGVVDAEVLAALLAALPPREQMDLALKGLDVVEVPWSVAVALELIWASAPNAKDALPTLMANAKAKGYMFAAAAGVAHAAIALAEGKTPAPSVDDLLQRTYGFWPRVRAALAALPVERREAWLLDLERDDREQPAESFAGAWPYWIAAPTKKIADRALAHVAKWKPKDPWGGARKEFADPRLRALIDAYVAAGNEADAARLEAALSKLR